MQAVHQLDAQVVLDQLASDESRGLSTEQVAERLDSYGHNQLAEATKVPAWRRFLHQFTDRLILILLGAALIAFVVTGELKTPVVVIVVVLVNAVLGFLQENRSEKSLDALRRLVVRQARVIRDGERQDIAADELVPGDLVLVEAGDKIPADGRVLVASNLEVDEAMLTGESTPVAKTTAPILSDAVPIGDRTCMVHMNGTVTRGRGEYVVTATGMHTEIGRIAGMINSTQHEKTPLQRQLDRLASSLAKLAGLIVLAVVALGLARGESLEDLFLTAVALAVAAIPEGLPAVTAVTLAIGVSTMARQNAIVKRLAAVETLGCTSVICSDKTGTLTLNEMTAVELFVTSHEYAVTGRGYGPVGEINGLTEHQTDLQPVLRAVALCNDATIRREPDDDEWRLVGDPTEGALVVLATKGGLDVEEIRRRSPRRAELPFDSATKLMATVHDTADGNVAIYVKGAPDVLIARSSGNFGPEHESLDRMAARGLRVLGVAERLVPADEFERLLAGGAELLDLLHGLTFLALIGIVDPPRSEAGVAISEAHAAGMSVKMITGDHAATATSIAGQLGLSGAVVTGAELDAMSDEELRDRVDDIAVFARVSPDHKLRVVTALQHNDEVVAMTGDGVNDAPALKKADIGVAMGITGTEVTKEAATMILVDDNFATIVGAVRQGRTIYDNIVKFVRFQLSTTIGFSALFLACGVFGIANGKPFTAVAILWVNLVMDGPPALALGVDPTGSDVMRRRPRRRDEPILTRPRWSAVLVAATVMAAGTLLLLWLAPGDPVAGTATVAGTMAFNAFVLFQLFNILSVRSDRISVFHRSTVSNRWLWVSVASVLALQIAATYVGFLQELFDTTSISLEQWVICAIIASSVLWAEELRKLVVRRRERLTTWSTSNRSAVTDGSSFAVGSQQKVSSNSATP
jgi:Ca2+-transporting ATPase